MTDRAPGQMIQRTVAATSAPRPLTHAPASVFDLGGAAPAAPPVAESAPAAPRHRRPATGMTALVLQTLRERGPLSALQLSQACGIDAALARRVCCKAALRGRIQRLGDPASDGYTAYAAADASAPAPALPAATPIGAGARFGLFSDGALRIEPAGAAPIELGPDVVRALCAFLLALPAGGAT